MTTTKKDTPRMGKIRFQVKRLPEERQQDDLYISLAIPIYCPRCKEEGTDIIKDGLEKKVKITHRNMNVKPAAKISVPTHLISLKL